MGEGNKVASDVASLPTVFNGTAASSVFEGTTSVFEGTAEELAELLRQWCDEDENYSVVDFAISIGWSKRRLMKEAGENEVLGEAVEYALSVQEKKVLDGILTGAIERSVGLKMLETYAGWKGTVGVVNVIQNQQGVDGGDLMGKVEMVRGLRGTPTTPTEGTGE